MFFLLFVWCSSVAAEAPRPLMVLGDSLSAAHNIPQQAGWVALLEHRLNGRDAPAPKVINASISGETSAGALARLPALLLQFQPSVVLVELGGNDGLRGLPPSELAANLDAIVHSSREAGAKVLLLGIDLPPNYGGGYRSRFRAVYADLAQRYQVPLVPFLLEGVALHEGLMQDDGVHPTAEGQPHVLDNVWPLLEPLL